MAASPTGTRSRSASDTTGIPVGALQRLRALSGSESSISARSRSHSQSRSRSHSQSSAGSAAAPGARGGQGSVTPTDGTPAGEYGGEAAALSGQGVTGSPAPSPVSTASLGSTPAPDAFGNRSASVTPASAEGRRSFWSRLLPVPIAGATGMMPASSSSRLELGSADAAAADDKADAELAFWAEIVHGGDAVVKRRSRQISEHARAGIPPHVRGIVWQTLCNGKDVALESRYRVLLRVRQTALIAPAARPLFLSLSLSLSLRGYRGGGG